MNMMDENQVDMEPIREFSDSRREVCLDLNKINQDLEDMKETLMATSVRAHILEMELCTLYNPEVKQSLQQLDESCQSCRRALERTTYTTGSTGNKAAAKMSAAEGQR